MALGSFISDLTSSLPNVLNISQVQWKIQYHKRMKPQNTEDSSLLDWASSTLEDTMGLISKLNGLPEDIANDEWANIDFDSFISLEEINESKITQNPIEQGAFRSVNKVKIPKQIKVTIARGGMGYEIEDTISLFKSLLPKARYGVSRISSAQETWESVKNGFNKALDFIGLGKQTETTIKETTNIPMEFRIITPFDMITNLNLVKFDYIFRQQTGRNMLIMDLTFEEIMSVERNVSFTKEKVKSPTDANTSQSGVLSIQK